MEFFLDIFPLPSILAHHKKSIKEFFGRILGSFFSGEPHNSHTRGCSMERGEKEMGKNVGESLMPPHSGPSSYVAQPKMLLIWYNGTCWCRERNYILFFSFDSPPPNRLIFFLHDESPREGRKNDFLWKKSEKKIKAQKFCVSLETSSDFSACPSVFFFVDDLTSHDGRVK